MVRRNGNFLIILLAVVSLSMAGCRANSGHQAEATAGELTPGVIESTEKGTPAHTAALGATPSAAPLAATASPELPATDDLAVPGLPFSLPVPDGWVVRETGDGLIIVEDAASLAAAELECPALLVTRVPGAASPGDVLAAYDLSGALRQKEIPLVIAGNPVDAIDATLISAATGRVYQVVLAPLVLDGEGWLLIASMPEGQAGRAWPALATMLGSIALAGG